MNLRHAQNPPRSSLVPGGPAAAITVRPRVACVPRLGDALPGGHAAPAAPGGNDDSLAAWAAALTGLVSRFTGLRAPSDPAPPARPAWRRVPFPLVGRLRGGG